jgi:hypothetical protein
MDMVFLLSEKGEAAGDAGAGRVGCKLIELRETILRDFEKEQALKIFDFGCLCLWLSGSVTQGNKTDSG